MFMMKSRRKDRFGGRLGRGSDSGVDGPRSLTFDRTSTADVYLGGVPLAFGKYRWSVSRRQPSRSLLIHKTPGYYDHLSGAGKPLHGDITASNYWHYSRTELSSCGIITPESEQTPAADMLDTQSSPPIHLIMQWIDEMWSQEFASLPHGTKVQESVDTTREPVLPPTDQQDFYLLEPLRTRQRKSYDGESRFLSPKPVIVLHPSSPLNNRLKRCNVSIRLLDTDGSPLQCHEQTHLHGPHGKETLLSIPHSRTPPISVKIAGKCDLRALRLGFTVEYETDDGYCGLAHLMSNEVQLIRQRSPGKRTSHGSHAAREYRLETSTAASEKRPADPRVFCKATVGIVCRIHFDVNALTMAAVVNVMPIIWPFSRSMMMSPAYASQTRYAFGGGHSVTMVRSETDATQMQMEDTSFVRGPPLKLVMQWIDEMWSQESTSVSFDAKDTAFEVTPELLPFSPHQDFQLLEPLRTRQRKSYDGESRFLSPRPVIMLNPDSPLANTLTQCSVTVKLLDVDGSPLDPHEQTHLFGSHGKDTFLSIPHGRTAPISVKLSGKIGIRALRLGFTIDYEMEDGSCGQAHLTSNEFQLARERCPGKRSTSKVSHVNMLHRNVKCE
ncbi:hypothetical protein PROFUN_07176 [Planoprotostelium fungivorum]|uniref:Uncharacterized protein n=1 Tax=Planoprotostelium fungivorum TaxID=1890364 RepID=A0A2P6NMA9_9EUKA|nr:hypothetical protein PROFUN_07176 [Planoprotostelium fungivorum]